MSKGKPSFLVSLTRSQFSSVAATVLDFGVLVFLVEVLHIWYVAATAVGAFSGAILNFTMGRTWSFVATHEKISNQAIRYTLVSGMSLALNTAGVFLITDKLGVSYGLSKAITAGIVGIFFNFPLHRGFVFKS